MRWFESRWVILLLLLLFVAFIVLIIIWGNSFVPFDASKRSDVGGTSGNYPPFHAPLWVDGQQTYESLAAQGYILDPAQYTTATILPVDSSVDDTALPLAFALRDPYTDTTNRQILLSTQFPMETYTSDGTVTTTSAGIGITAVASYDQITQQWMWRISPA